MKRTIILSMFLAISILACEEQIDWNITGYEQLLIVEGQITNERRAHQVKLTRSVRNLNEQPENIRNALVRIHIDDSVHTLTENPTQSGIYTTDSSFVGVVGPEYRLEIVLGNDTFTAETQMVPVSNLAPLQHKNINGTDYHQVTHEPEVSPSFTEYYFKWQNVTNDTGDYDAKSTFYNLNTIDFNRQLAPETEKIYFPSGTLIVRKKHSLTSDHSTFLRTVLLETEWKGGLFDAPTGLVKSNLSGNAMGYFSAHAVAIDTTIVE